VELNKIITLDSEFTDGLVARNLARKLCVVHLCLHVAYLQYAALISSKYLVQARSILQQLRINNNSLTAVCTN